jgi:3-oxoadipate enol-lactonase
MPFVESNEVRLRYRLEGKPDAPVILFSNSLGADLSMWDPQVSALRNEYGILRYDTRGHGLSSVPAGVFTQEDLGRDVLAVLDAAGISRAYFCGISMGGQTGIWLGANAPERFERLMLCNTAAHIGTPEAWNARIAAVRAGGMGAVVSATIERWFTKRFVERAPKTIASIHQMILDTPPAGYMGCCEAIRDADLIMQAPHIGAPVTVVSGAYDPSTTPAQGRVLSCMIPDSRYVELEAAHITNIEVPGEFTSALRDCFARAAQTAV